MYRVLDEDGCVRSDAVEPELSSKVALKIYGNMVRLEAMDDIFYNAQRQVNYTGQWHHAFKGAVSFHCCILREGIRHSRCPPIHCCTVLCLMLPHFVAEYFFSLNRAFKCRRRLFRRHRHCFLFCCRCWS